MQIRCNSLVQLIVSTVSVVLQHMQSMSMLCHAMLCCALPTGQLLHTSVEPLAWSQRTIISCYVISARFIRMCDA